MHDLEFDLSRSPKDEVDGAIRKPSYDFLLIIIVNICLSAVFYEI